MSTQLLAFHLPVSCLHLATPFLDTAAAGAVLAVPGPSLCTRWDPASTAL